MQLRQKLFGSSTINTGVSMRHDLNHRFLIIRRMGSDGSYFYLLSNTSRKDGIKIRREMFDRFRKAIRDTSQIDDQVDLKIDFFGERAFRISGDSSSSGNLVISSSEQSPDLSGSLMVSKDSLRTLLKLLFDERLEHPSEILERIVGYHRMFQFSFEEATASINSDLVYRKNILSTSESFIPSLARNLVKSYKKGEDVEGDFDKKKKGSADDKKADRIFKSRLAERNSEGGYSINYEELFGKEADAAIISEPEGEAPKSKKRKQQAYLPLPIHASEVKNFARLPFNCELSLDDMEFIRLMMVRSKKSEFFIGFEILDAVHRVYGKLRTFRFPLYYIKVEITESGRMVYLTPTEGQSVFLNHMALITLIEQYSKGSSNDVVTKFLEALGRQRVELEGAFCSISLKRNLPASDEIFKKTREILLGFIGENGKGGILSGLKILGIECDLDSVNLYEVPKNQLPTTEALAYDLSQIVMRAQSNPSEYYDSLLGRFLNPEGMGQAASGVAFCKTPMFPGGVPPSTRKLLNRLNVHDLVVLEGPPGTGKTYTIMNLFLHCVITGKKLLVVSDKEGAIHALTEKIQDYLMGRDRISPQAKRLDQLWKYAIKVVDNLPRDGSSLEQWISDLRRMLHIAESPVDFSGAKVNLGDIQKIDSQILSFNSRLQTLVGSKLSSDSSSMHPIAPKYKHATTIKDIKGLIYFVRNNQLVTRTLTSNSKSSARRDMLKITQRFLLLRRWLKWSVYKESAFYFELPDSIDSSVVNELKGLAEVLSKLIKKRPRTLGGFKLIAGHYSNNPVIGLLYKQWKSLFPPHDDSLRIKVRSFLAFFSHPMMKNLKHILDLVTNQMQVLGIAKESGGEVLYAYQALHNDVFGEDLEHVSLTLEILSSLRSSHTGDSTQDILNQLGILQKKRDDLLRECFIARLTEIFERAYRAQANHPTALTTSIDSLLDSLASFDSLEDGMHVLQEIRKKLVEAFPIWLCRKQTVSSLFPEETKLFDLAIVDEATQCRVDDSLPLLFRTKKLMVVGDEKQTVLNKNSSIDDYLFTEFKLEEHLRSTQARGIKGGGSNIFALIKSIKQASVMLDEHYRCPPEIIEYSNRYVYGSELKTMQWVPRGKSAALYVDYSERKKTNLGPQRNGKYKGIEIDMVERFYSYMEKSIKEIEVETKRSVNVETDVAICYFLLKNEPYFKDTKGQLLSKLKRGDELLDGAGAALQGKERDYIFYFWDINRGNMAAFKQGDEEDKRKGELNVLMSRPKKRAYHFLHGGFENLEHRRTSITDFLWKKMANHSSKIQVDSHLVPRTHRPGGNFFPWSRSSGPMMREILNETLSALGVKPVLENESQTGVIVGDPSFRVDLMILPPDLELGEGFTIALVDLAGFAGGAEPGQSIVDFYFQLTRAKPTLIPVFAFIHELLDPRSVVVANLKELIEKQRMQKKRSSQSDHFNEGAKKASR